MGEALEETSGKSLRRLGTQAKRLRKHPFFQQGEAIEAALRPLEEAEAKAERKAEIERQLAAVRREMLEVWSWQSREAIEAELTRLQAKQNVNGRSETGVLEVQVEVLGMLADPSNFESKATITDRARELAGLAESDIDEGARAIAEAVAAGELGGVVDAFRWVALEQGETRVERIAPMILLAFHDPSQLLSELDASQQGQLVLEWLAPPKRPELQFAMSVLWADPDGASSRSPEDARAVLLDQSRAARATSVITATGMLQSRGRLDRYAESAGTRSLLIEMAYQLWLDGFTHRKVATGDVLAATLAPELDAERAIVIEDGELSISWVGDAMRVSVDPFYNAKPQAAVVPASASVWLHGASEPLMPALKLLELEARGDRNALVWAGQGIAHGAQVAGDAANEWVESKAKGGLAFGEAMLESSVTKAREVVTEYVPDLGDLAKTTKLLGKHGDAVDMGHRHHIDADVLKEVESSIPPNTEVWVDTRLGRGDVVVDYDVHDGVIDASSVRIVTGPDASASWIILHGATVSAVRKYVGLQGRIRKLLAELRLLLTGVDEHAGSARWEAKHEVEKLPGIVDAELARLRAATPGSKEADEIQETLEALAEQFEDWSRVVDGELTPGEARGLIAAHEKKLNLSPALNDSAYAPKNKAINEPAIPPSLDDPIPSPPPGKANTSELLTQDIGREIPRGATAEEKRAARDAVFSIYDALYTSRIRDAHALAGHFPSHNVHELTADLKGWVSMDLVPNNRAAFGGLSLLVRFEGGTISLMVRNTH